MRRLSLLGECAIPQLDTPPGEPTIDEGEVKVRSSINMESDSDRVLYCVLANEVGLLFVVEQAAADIPPILPYDASFAALL